MPYIGLLVWLLQYWYRVKPEAAALFLEVVGCDVCHHSAKHT